MRIDEAFPSRFIKSSDLQGRAVRVVIAQYAMEEVGDTEKLTLYFQGKQRGIVLNKTNATAIGELYGPEMDKWIGQAIELYPAKTNFGGKTVDCIRIRGGAQQQQAVAKPPVNGQQAVEQHDERNPPPIDLDDEIPF